MSACVPICPGSLSQLFLNLSSYLLEAADGIGAVRLRVSSLGAEKTFGLRADFNSGDAWSDAVYEAQSTQHTSTCAMASDPAAAPGAVALCGAVLALWIVRRRYRPRS
jgi:MYXO-CTERM domain-containing protein